MDVQQIGLVAGIALMVVGTALGGFAFQRRKRVTAQVSNGIAIGGDVKGSIVVNQSPASPASAKHGGHGLTIIAIVVEIVGIVVTLWHAYHLASS